MRRYGLFLAAALVVGCDANTDPPEPPGPEVPCLDCEITPPAVVEHAPLTPIIGGTLAVSPDGSLAVAADPEGHQIFVVNLASRVIRGAVQVAGGEPGRVALGDADAYVALRTGGVSRIELASATEKARFEACSAPRGLALDGDALHVACAGGDLLTLDAETGAERARVHLAPDLRDVVVGEGRLYVSTFRAAELLVIEGGAIVDRWAPRAERPEEGARVPTRPTVAWRTVGLADGGVAMLHQRAQLSRVVVQSEGGYGAGDGRCSRSVVAPTLTVFEPDGDIRRDGVIVRTVLAVDLATTGESLMIAAPGNRRAGLALIDRAESGRCVVPAAFADAEDEQFVAVAADALGNGYALRRAPLSLVGFRGPTQTFTVDLDEGAVDTGHALFHRDAGRGIACASCHPEGGDDGHAWLFEGFGLRRTQHLRGGLKGSEPFHWEGDLADIEALVAEVMVKRMGGEPLSAAHADRLLSWIDALPAVRVDPPTRDAAVARGEALFNDASVACSACHGADGRGNNRTYDVGTGGYFQVPSLEGLAARPPYLHDGCAPTLADRFGPCGGGDRHGRTSQLDAAEIDDLVAFLKTL